MRDAVITAAVRSPIGKRNGGLAAMHAAELSALMLNELVSRASLDPGLIDDVHWGNVISIGQQSGNIGRMAVLAATEDGWRFARRKVKVEGHVSGSPVVSLLGLPAVGADT